LKTYKKIMTIGSIAVNGGVGVICSPEALKEILNLVAEGGLRADTFMRTLLHPLEANNEQLERIERIKKRTKDGEDPAKVQATEPFDPVIYGAQSGKFVIFRTDGDGEFPVRITLLENSDFGHVFSIGVDILERLDEPADLSL
jgi:hypothetical protein